HSFLYSGGTYTTIDVPVANSFTFARGINDNGQIVGYYSDDIGTHGFLLSGGSYTTLDDPLASGHITTYANGINDLGQLVGAYVYGSGEHVFLYNNGTYTSIDDPLAIDGPGRSTIAYGINDLGQIVGSYVNPFPSQHGFLYSVGAFITLNDPSSNAETIPLGTNNTQIVGYSGVGTSRHAFVATIGPNLPPPDGTTANMILRHGADGLYGITTSATTRFWLPTSWPMSERIGNLPVA